MLFQRFFSIFAAAIVIAITLFVVLVQIPNMAKSRLEKLLHAAGFEQALIESASMTTSGLRASNVRLDEYGFDLIPTLEADISWPGFLTGAGIKELRVKDMTLSRESGSLPSAARQLMMNLLSLPPYRLSLANVTIDLGTTYGDLRFTLDATVEPKNEAKSHDIRARLRAEQYQLGFDSTWEGTLSDNGLLDLAGTVFDGRANLGPLRISRFTGWAGTTANQDGYTIQSQLEAGSAAFMDVPLQNISLVTDLAPHQSSIIVRSGISGMPDILFTGDYTKVDDVANFNAILKGNNLASLLDYIGEIKKTEKTIDDELLKQRAFELTWTYQPDRGFVGGPLPFLTALKTSETKVFEGNILFYPDTMDVRGALETTPPMALALQRYFKIPPANIRQNFIRLDGDARAYLGFKKPEETAPSDTAAPQTAPVPTEETIAP